MSEDSVFNKRQPSWVSIRRRRDCSCNTNDDNDERCSTSSGLLSFTGRASPIPSDEESGLISAEEGENSESENEILHSGWHDTDLEEEVEEENDEEVPLPIEDLPFPPVTPQLILNSHNSINDPFRWRNYLNPALVRERPPPPEEWQQEDPPPLELPLDEAFAEELWRMPGDDKLLEPILYFTQDILIYCCPITIFLMTLMLINAQSTITIATKLTAWIFGVASIWSIYKFFTRPDYLPENPSLVKQQIQLHSLFLSFGLIVVGIILGNIRPETLSWLEYIKFSLRRPLQSTPWRIYSWPWLFLKCFGISYLIISTLCFPVTLYRMGGTNRVLLQIVKFELVAFFFNVLWTAAPFLLYDFALRSAPPPTRRNLIDSLLHWAFPPPPNRPTEKDYVWFPFYYFLSQMVIFYVLGVLVRYPEIDVERRQGLVGYMYMGFITNLQRIFKLVYIYYLFISIVAIMTLTKFAGELFEMEDVKNPLLNERDRHIPWEMFYLQESYWDTFSFWAFVFRTVYYVREIQLFQHLRAYHRGMNQYLD